MSRDTDNSLFINFSLPRFYQQLFSEIGTYQKLGNRIIKGIKAAHVFRQVEQVRALSSLLLNIPIKEYGLIAQYYLAWSDCRESKFHNTILERLAEQSLTYKTKALLSRAAVEGYQDKIEPELYFYKEALKTASTISDYVEASRCIAVVNAKERFHSVAVKDLERLIPIIRHAEPLVYYDFLNSYATELNEVGRKDEARNISRLVIVSPFAHAYPEWQETAQKLKPPSPSFVSVPSTEPDPVEVETIEAHHASEPEQEQPSTVIAFPALREAPRPQKPERLSPQEVAELTPADMRELILAAIKAGAVQESEYIKMMGMVGLVKNGPADKVLDLEDNAVLDDLIVMWSHQIDPEELTAVISALRDCDDRLRQKSIMDRIIRIAFEETQLCGLTEEEWRRNVERRLPKQ